MPPRSKFQTRCTESQTMADPLERTRFAKFGCDLAAGVLRSELPGRHRPRPHRESIPVMQYSMSINQTRSSPFFLKKKLIPPADLFVLGAMLVALSRRPTSPAVPLLSISHSSCLPNAHKQSDNRPLYLQLHCNIRCRIKRVQNTHKTRSTNTSIRCRI